MVDAFLLTLDRRKFKVHSVQRVQNIGLWQSYCVKKSSTVAREDDPSRAERKYVRNWLWHGCPGDVVPKILQQGFNRSFCARPRGEYSPRRVFDATRRRREKRHALREGRLLRARRVVFHLSALLRARRHGRPVHLRGESGRRPVQPRRARRADAGHPRRTEWHPRRRHGFQEDDSSMSTPQKSSKRASSLQVRSRPAGDDARNLLFDSTVDDVYDPSIFVTYHDAQAYPEYLIKFSQSGQAGGHPKAGTKSHDRYRPNVLAGTEFE